MLPNLSKKKLCIVVMMSLFLILLNIRKFEAKFKGKKFRQTLSLVLADDTSTSKLKKHLRNSLNIFATFLQQLQFPPQRKRRGLL